MKYVIIGVGAAGIMAAKTIRKADKESYYDFSRCPGSLKMYAA